jgi:hypothetical protein
MFSVVLVDHGVPAVSDIMHVGIYILVVVVGGTCCSPLCTKTNVPTFLNRKVPMCQKWIAAATSLLTVSSYVVLN